MKDEELIKKGREIIENQPKAPSDEPKAPLKQPKAPTRGRGGNANFPNSKVGLIQTDDDRKFVSQLLKEVLVEYRQPKVKDDDELQERLNDYFYRCAVNGQVPTVEEMVMSTGYAYQTVYAWETGLKRGFSERTGEIIKKAKDYLKTFDAKLVVSGKLNFLAYCFRAKNYYGMSDKTEYVITPGNNSESDYNSTEITTRYQLGDGSSSD